MRSRMSEPVITTLRAVPPFARGVVRDLRVRWALEEAGRSYRVKLIDHAETKQQPYLDDQPFGQVPFYEEPGIRIFETGAILLHIASGSPGLLPSDPQARIDAISWIFAGLNSLEPTIQSLMNADIFFRKKEWAQLSREDTEQMAKDRLERLATALGDKDYLTGSFTAGDLMVATVLRILRHTDLVTSHPVLGPYLARCEARPAFCRAVDAQMELYAQD
jgi:glutathione S-transferase